MRKRPAHRIVTALLGLGGASVGVLAVSPVAHACECWPYGDPLHVVDDAEQYGGVGIEVEIGARDCAADAFYECHYEARLISDCRGQFTPGPIRFWTVFEGCGTSPLDPGTYRVAARIAADGSFMLGNCAPFMTPQDYAAQCTPAPPARGGCATCTATSRGSDSALASFVLLVSTIASRRLRCWFRRQVGARRVRR